MWLNLYVVYYYVTYYVCTSRGEATVEPLFECKSCREVGEVCSQVTTIGCLDTRDYIAQNALLCLS